ncbi:MAG: hypothetical protein PUC47_10630 [Oscillospiraceae bacterium]|nr:hypothetical protein [Oscillospiraceae bacterium]
MRLYAAKRRLPRFLPAAALAASLLLAAAYLAGRTDRSADEQARQAAEDSIRRALVTCYAIEGSFPQNLDELKERYGLTVDGRFVVEYEALGGNIMPQVTVINRGGSAL